VKNFIRVSALLIAGCLAACGGTGGTAPTAQAANPPATADHAWDSWNWDEGGFGD
jgi:hypothetical protein